MTACTSRGASVGLADQPASDSIGSSPAVNSETAASTGQPAEGSGSILTVYFSWSGNTRQVAKRVNELVGGSLFELRPVTAYSDNYDAVVEQAQREQEDGYLPPLVDTPQDWDAFDTVFLGYPIWWYDAPQVVKSFLDICDASGKTVIAFCTSGGSRLSTSLESLRELSPDMELVEGITLSDRDIAGELPEVDAWLEGLGY